ncbi:hypothetical protein MICRO80W_170005 [Micrococcus luteus]|nr:hypothetical protein MICRO80W_170005 [Micrococcus luteus]
MDRGGTRDHPRGPDRGPRRVPGDRARRPHRARRPRGRPPGHRDHPADRRPLPSRVHGRDHAHGRLPAGGHPARRPHPHGGVRAVGVRGQRGRHLQVPCRAGAGLPHRRRAAGGRRRDRLLPHRRAVLPHLVRAQVPARPRGRPQLRRLLDRVGQRRAPADRRRRRAGRGPRALSPGTAWITRLGHHDREPRRARRPGRDHRRLRRGARSREARAAAGVLGRAAGAAGALRRPRGRDGTGRGVSDPAVPRRRARG